MDNTFGVKYSEYLSLSMINYIINDVFVFISDSYKTYHFDIKLYSLVGSGIFDKATRISYLVQTNPLIRTEFHDNEDYLNDSSKIIDIGFSNFIESYVKYLRENNLESNESFMLGFDKNDKPLLDAQLDLLKDYMNDHPLASGSIFTEDIVLDIFRIKAKLILKKDNFNMFLKHILFDMIVKK
jgi:hypothetical protein